MRRGQEAGFTQAEIGVATDAEVIPPAAAIFRRLTAARWSRAGGAVGFVAVVNSGNTPLICAAQANQA